VQCDENGNVLWEHEYKDDLLNMIRFVHESENGDIITLGNIRDGSSVFESSIYLSKLNHLGELEGEVVFGGSGSDLINYSERYDNYGILATISTQSMDGTFSASKTDIGADFLALFDNSMKMVWHIGFEGFSFDDIFINEGFIYLLIGNGDVQYLVQLDGDGNELWRVECGTRFSDIIGWADALAVTSNRNRILLINDTGEVIKDIPFRYRDRIKSIILYDNSYMIILERVYGLIDTSDITCIVTYRTELVYSGYNNEDSLIWEESRENTHEDLLKYKWKPIDLSEEEI
jgi:hypothetical protein